MRRIRLAYILFGFLIIGCNSNPSTVSKSSSETKGEGFTFAFLTDIHVQPELGAARGFQKAIDTINEIGPDFVLTGGDLVKDALDETFGRADSLYTLYQEMCRGFRMPVYNTMGNHEIYGWHRQEEGIEANPEYGKKMYENRLGDRYYSFNHKGWHFIVLDAISRNDTGHYIGRIDGEEVRWLANDLARTDSTTPIVVSVHIPFITSWTQLNQGSLAPGSETLVITNSLEVLRMFAHHNLKLVLQGHLHFLEDIYVENRVHFITAGAVSGRWWENKPGSTPEEGFLMVRIHGEELDWEYVDYGWVPPH